MSGKTDFSFDERVVNLYNKARAHPPEVSQQVGSIITAQVGNDRKILEIGVGTGRIGYPVAGAGGHVLGFDLSPHMLGETAENKPADMHGSLNIIQADMHHIPCPSNSFDGVLAVHVLHLSRDWQRVIREAARILRIDGAFIQGDDWIDPQSVIGRLRNEVRRYAVTLDPSLMPPAAGVSKTDLLNQLGATQHEEVIAAEWSIWMSPNERLESISQRIDSESWIFTEEMFEKIFTHLQQCAAEWWDDLDEPQEVKRRFVLKIARGEWTSHV